VDTSHAGHVGLTPRRSPLGPPLCRYVASRNSAAPRRPRYSASPKARRPSGISGRWSVA